MAGARDELIVWGGVSGTHLDTSDGSLLAVDDDRVDVAPEDGRHG